MNRRVALLACLLGLAAPAASLSQDALRVLVERQGRQSASGTIRGYGVDRYAVSGRAGQRLDVSLSAGNSSLYFNVTAPSGQVIYVGSGSAEPDNYRGVLPETGRYAVIVYLMRNEARRGRVVRYSLDVALDDRGQAAGEGPSFDCRRARPPAERAACFTPAIARLDRELAAVYAEALTAAGRNGDAAQARLRASQQAWIGRRNACARGQLVACVTDSYQRRIAAIQAEWLLEPNATATYACGERPAIVARFYRTYPSAARLQRGDVQVTAVAERSASGVRYVTDAGVSFWTRRDEALVEWPRGNSFRCEAARP